MGFAATPDELMPELSAREELTVLARALAAEGYDDHLAGHITIRQADGTFLCNPWFLTWDEVRPEQVIRIDLDGAVVDGDWPVPPGIPLHLELHRRRHVEVVVHNHSRFGIVWADAQRIPPVLDQSSALGGGSVVVVDEYDGGVSDEAIATEVVEAIGDADIALLANHGVLITAGSVRAAHQRAVAFEQRCRHALLAEHLGGGKPVKDAVAQRMEAKTGDEFIGFWEAMVRRVLRADPGLLGGIG